MRLRTSKNNAEEEILKLLNRGYAISSEIFAHYEKNHDSGTFDEDSHVAQYYTKLNDWIRGTQRALSMIFPTNFEGNFFISRFSGSSFDYLGTNQAVGYLVYEQIPTYIERLYRVLEIHLRRYTDLPVEERLFVEDIDSFVKVRDVNRAMVSQFMKDGRVELSEDQVQLGLEAILDVPFHKKDWGGEINDLYTANLELNGSRRPSAFLLKGNGLTKKEMAISDCGKNGDQILRLFQSPAQLFVIQYVGPISDSVVSDIHSKTLAHRANGNNANYLIIDGQDTARLLYAYGKLPKSAWA
jgi:hypothetical protein